MCKYVILVVLLHDNKKGETLIHQGGHCTPDRDDPRKGRWTNLSPASSNPGNFYDIQYIAPYFFRNCDIHLTELL